MCSTFNQPPPDEQIVFLADQPTHLSTVAAWVYHEWLHEWPDITLDTVVARFTTHLVYDRIPITMITLHGGTPIATASIYVDDLPERRDLSPWLAAVYVIAAARGQGVGSRMVAAIEALAQRLGIVRLHLFTPDQEAFYARMGWATIDHVVTHGEPVVVMAKDLIAPAQRIHGAHEGDDVWIESASV